MLKGRTPKTVRNLHHSLSHYWGSKVLAGRGILEEEEVENLFLLLLLVFNQKM